MIQRANRCFAHRRSPIRSHCTAIAPAHAIVAGCSSHRLGLPCRRLREQGVHKSLCHRRRDPFARFSRASIAVHGPCSAYLSLSSPLYPSLTHPSFNRTPSPPSLSSSTRTTRSLSFAQRLCKSQGQLGHSGPQNSTRRTICTRPLHGARWRRRLSAAWHWLFRQRWKRAPPRERAAVDLRGSGCRSLTKKATSRCVNESSALSRPNGRLTRSSRFRSSSSRACKLCSARLRSLSFPT